MKLAQLLERAAVSPEFRKAVVEFRASGRPNDRLRFDVHAPPVKIERTLTKLLEAFSDHPIERVEVSGSSGCEFFRGRLRFETADGSHHVRFHWDCRWRAMQEGWIDYFGFPDQIRAAREFGYDCFREWSLEGSPESATV